MSASSSETPARLGTHPQAAPGIESAPEGDAPQNGEHATAEEPPGPGESPPGGNGTASPGTPETAADRQQPEPAHAPTDAPTGDASAVGTAGAAEDPAPVRPPAPVGEVELKLLVDVDLLAGFNAAPVIAENARNKGSRKRLKAVYYDTADQILRKNGLSLRVRQSGQRFVQTMKAEDGDDPLRRGEWEASVASFTPDVGLAMPFVPAKLREALTAQPLEPVFISDIRRHQRLIDLPSGTVEIAFDQGVLKAGERSMAVSEIELELKEGSPSVVYEVALALAEHGAVRPSIRSKAARGFDLAANVPPPAKKARKLDVDPSLPLDEAFATILASCLRDLLVSVPAAEDGRDPEGVHQVRVTLRRLRSALDSMATLVTSETLEVLRADARWLASTLSAARTWDVFKNETLAAVAGNCPAVAGFDALGEGAEERRLAAYGDARRALSDNRTARFVIRLGGWVEARGWRSDVGPEHMALLAEPAFSFAQRILSVHHNKVLKRGRKFKSLTAPERHRLRLAVKKLRYVADFLLPLCTDRKSARQFTTRLADLQEELGAFNDMTTTGALLSDLVAASAERGAAAAAIAGWQAHAMVDAEARLRNAWRDFAKTRPPWAQPALL